MPALIICPGWLLSVLLHFKKSSYCLIQSSPPRAADCKKGELLFSNNTLSEHLTTSHPSSMRGFVRHFATDCFRALGGGEPATDGTNSLCQRLKLALSSLALLRCSW
jgi:hypothetical protein